MKCLITLALLVLGVATVQADEAAIHLVIHNHAFVPAQLQVPARQKIKLMIENQDATPEEFESHELNREKIITGNNTITLYVGPLEPGHYPFFGDFHQGTAQGILIAK